MENPLCTDPGRALRILQTSRAFQSVEAADLEGFQPRIAEIPAGAVLFRQGDAADVAYVVEQGLLGLHDQPEPKRGDRPFRRVVTGELVGEYGLLCDQPRSATAVALTACSVLLLERGLLERLLASRPQITSGLLRQIAGAASRGRGGNGGGVRSVAVLDLQPGSAGTAAAIAALSDELERLSGDAACEGLRIGIHRPTDEEDCQRQLIAIADGDAIGVLLLSDRQLLSPRNQALIDNLATLQNGPAPVADPPPAGLAVHLWPADTHRARTAPGCSGPAAGGQPLHIRPGRPGEIARLARMLLGRATILVLGGGGARGFAHIGALAAMEELGGPAIDMVMGVSIGSLVASLVAFDCSAAQILSELERVIIRSRPYGLKLPTDALFSLENSRRALQEFFGDARIEDAWRPYRAYSTNLSRKRLHGWSSGSIPDAVIASMSVPGIFPPCRDGEGHLHVDGGILNNLPIREARRLSRGQVIAVSLDALPRDGAAADAATGKVTGEVRRQSLATTIIDAMMCSSHAEGLRQAELADAMLCPEIQSYSFLGWSSYRAIHAAGHREAMRVLGGAARG
ncbi:MAG: patatin-like phospholipase family protein [Cyanobacteriota bacterium]|nr:patatin-like phospholipase family protein [Cyanobacteriota bacterium]